MNGQNQEQVYEKPRSTTSWGKLFGLGTLRFFQFASAVIVMSLLAYAIHVYNFHGSKKTNFVLSVGVISVFYSIALFILAIAIPKVVMVGIYIIAEVIMCLLWFSAFIVDAKVQGDHSCSISRVTIYNPKYGTIGEYQSSNGNYNPFTGMYTTNREKTACESAKATIAFSGLAWLLFTISSIIIGVSIMKPIIACYGAKGLWKTGTSMGTRVDRASALSLTEPVSGNYDMGPGIPEEPVVPPADGMADPPIGSLADQHTMSTGNTNGTYNQEKSNVSAEVPPVVNTAPNV